jgi:hypothetical protein
MTKQLSNQHKTDLIGEQRPSLSDKSSCLFLTAELFTAMSDTAMTSTHRKETVFFDTSHFLWFRILFFRRSHLISCFRVLDHLSFEWFSDPLRSDISDDIVFSFTHNLAISIFWCLTYQLFLEIKRWHWFELIWVEFVLADSFFRCSRWVNGSAGSMNLGPDRLENETSGLFFNWSHVGLSCAFLSLFDQSNISEPPTRTV